MKPTKLEVGKWYRINNLYQCLEGTSRVVKCVEVMHAGTGGRFRSCDTGDSLHFHINDVDCWVPAVGEEAWFWNNGSELQTKWEHICYDHSKPRPFVTNGFNYQNCRPIEAEDRNQTFTADEREAMREEQAVVYNDVDADLEARVKALEGKDQGFNARAIEAVAGVFQPFMCWQAKPRKE